MRVELRGKHVFYGAVVYIVGVVQFFVCVFVTALHFGPPSYDPLRITISDLQAVNCGIFQGNEVCSPLHLLANTSVAVLGLSLILGSLLIRTALPADRGRTSAIGLLVVAGLATFVNAFTPEDVTIIGDTATALVAFLCANFGLIQVGRLMSRDPKWRNFHIFTEISGIIGLTGLILDGADLAGPLGGGGNEWLIVGPILVWALAVGVRLLGPERLLHSAGRGEIQVGRTQDREID